MDELLYEGKLMTIAEEYFYEGLSDKNVLADTVKVLKEMGIDQKKIDAVLTTDKTDFEKWLMFCNDKSIKDIPYEDERPKRKKK